MLEQNSFSFFFQEKQLRTEATKVFWNIIHLKKTFFCFFFVIFSNFFFNRKKNHVWKKSTKHSEGKFLCCIFSSVKTFSPLRFRKPSVVSSFQSWKNMFFQKNPPKSSTHKTFVFHLVSRNIFHLKHFFLDFYFHFFVFFLRSKTFFRVELSGGTTVFFPLGFTQSIKKIQFQEKTFNHLLCEKSFGRWKTFLGAIFSGEKKNQVWNWVKNVCYFQKQLFLSTWPSGLFTHYRYFPHLYHSRCFQVKWLHSAHITK